jgi:hypothetical protein
VPELAGHPVAEERVEDRQTDEDGEHQPQRATGSLQHQKQQRDTKYQVEVGLHVAEIHDGHGVKDGVDGGGDRRGDADEVVDRDGATGRRFSERMRPEDDRQGEGEVNRELDDPQHRSPAGRVELEDPEGGARDREAARCPTGQGLALCRVDLLAEVRHHALGWLLLRHRSLARRLLERWVANAPAERPRYPDHKPTPAGHHPGGADLRVYHRQLAGLYSGGTSRSGTEIPRSFR